MISNRLVPNIDVFTRIEPSKFSSVGNTSGVRFQQIEKPETSDFKSVFSGLIENLNQDVQRPDQLLQEQMMGNSNIDVHDVITAINKSQTAVQLATNVTTKIITAYDKVMQISI